MVKILISSTCYDLGEVRVNLKEKIEQTFGFNVTLSDKNDILYNPKEHTHESCLNAVKEHDIVIHIVGKRWGGKAIPKALNVTSRPSDSKGNNFINNYDEGNVSITQAEVLYAFQSGIPVFTFIMSEVLTHHKLYEENNKSESYAEKTFKNSDYKKGTIKFIFDFIDYIRLRLNNNGYFSFDNSIDIFNIFKTQIGLYFSDLLKTSKQKVISNTDNSITFYPSYQHIDWGDLLNNTEEINLCIFFTGSEWDSINFPLIKKYIEEGGKMNIYLPNPELLKSKFFYSQIVREDYKSKIFRTYKKYSQIGENLKIKFIDEGFNYVFALISKKNKDGASFLYSAYVNNDYKSEYPAVVINDIRTSNSMVQSYIAEEIKFLNKQEGLPAFEESRYLTWDIENNRVFVSMSFDCEGACKFCYVDSILEQKPTKKIKKLGSLLADFILNDDRFEDGINGTKIMIGAFSEPLHRNSADNTIDFIQTIGPKENVIHIATRIGFDKHRHKLFKRNYNVLINFSFSTFDRNFERNNHTNRFENAERLIKEKYKVAFYIRPIVPGKTIKDIGQLIKTLEDIGVKDITIGELYYDEKIKEKMQIFNVKDAKKTLILDHTRKLTKNESEDYDSIMNEFKKNGFNVNQSSQELIDTFIRRTESVSLPLS